MIRALTLIPKDKQHRVSFLFSVRMVSLNADDELPGYQPPYSTSFTSPYHLLCRGQDEGGRANVNDYEWMALTLIDCC